MNAYNKAVGLLKIRRHYSQELAKKLGLRGFQPPEIAEVINRLTEQGLLNDEEFIQIFLENLMRFKTFGFYGLKAKLMQRGIDGGLAEQLLKENLSLAQETDIAQRVAEKEKSGDKIKLAQKLARKGFRNQVIRQVINNI